MKPRLTCLCSSRDLCPVHDADDDDRDEELERRLADDEADARANRARERD